MRFTVCAIITLVLAAVLLVGLAQSAKAQSSCVNACLAQEQQCERVTQNWTPCINSYNACVAKCATPTPTPTPIATPTPVPTPNPQCVAACLAQEQQCERVTQNWTPCINSYNSCVAACPKN